MVSLRIFLLSLISAIDLIQCSVNVYLSKENSVQTCFTLDQRPAVCVDPQLCQHVESKLLEGSETNCAETGKVCCPYGNEFENRGAFYVPRWEWDWGDWLHNWTEWARPPTIIQHPGSPTGIPGLPSFPPIPGSNGSTTSSPNTMKPPVAAEPPTPPTKCGVRQNIKVRDEEEKDDLGFIVGGNEAVPHSYPWMVAVHSGGRFICGGAIIDQRYVLCAAHCVSNKGRITKAEQISLLIGAHSRSSTGTMYKVEKVIVHSGYNEQVMQNDMSMFKLAKPITFDKTADKICLPTSGQVCDYATNKTAILAGWGTTSSGGSVSNVLKDVKVPFISTKDCQKAYNTTTMVTSKQICAGFLGVGGKDTCQGDSGGPLLVQPESKTNLFVQCGVVSWGRGCADRNYPGVYTKVSEYLSWIKDNMK